MAHNSVYVIAGEPSGDTIGASIISKMQEMATDIEIKGVGGEKMAAAGMTSLFDIKEISVGGIFELIPHIRKIKRLINETVEDILKLNPAVLVTIDSPGFAFRVARQVRKRSSTIKLIHIVAPSVWAWRPKRAKKLAKLYDKLLTLFDFEPQYFIKEGLDTEFIGHPAVEYIPEIDVNNKSGVMLMPGSRMQEIKSLLPIFIEAVKLAGIDTVTIPTLSHLVDEVKKLTSGVNVRVITNRDEQIEAMRRTKLCIVASGTATLELALCGANMIVCYKLAPISFWIIKQLVRVKFISLVNIILNEMVVPELIQQDCNPSKIFAEMAPFLNGNANQNEQGIRHRLFDGFTMPSAKAAKIILETLSN